VRRKLRIAGLVLATAVVVVALVGVWAYAKLRASLPRLDGSARLVGLTAPVRVDRDELGIPTIRGRSRVDVARATGFLHAQDRFFQMDLLRRRAAGELAALVGRAAVGVDREVRPHRFRTRARAALAALDEDGRRTIDAYAAGVNAGLSDLGAHPFEYLLLRAAPEVWQPEDSLLCLFAMFVELEDADGERESARGVLHEVLPEQLAAFLDPVGTEWDAPLDGPALATPAAPGAEVFDLRLAPSAGPPAKPAPLPASPGSNSWAVDGAHTASGAALLANDMHLPLAVPSTWYRIDMIVGGDAGSGERRLTGLSLPGTPTLAAGSNGHVAWGLTVAHADVVDVVLIETDPRDPSRYLSPEGPRAFARDLERIRVRGAAEETVEVVSTIWGPIVKRDGRGRPRAAMWTAHDRGADLGFMNLEGARTVSDALALANRSGVPPLNFVCADDAGRIGWTLAGRLPRRVGWDGRLPTSLSDGRRRWDGWLPPELYPRVVSPASGRVWTANARVVAGAALAAVGDGGYNLGARARQIRDDLAAIDKAAPSDMLRVQLDDRAVFLARWQKLLLHALGSASRPSASRAEVRGFVENWGGRADAGSVGYRAVRSFRSAVVERVMRPLTARCRASDPHFDHNRLPQLEGPVWRLLMDRPRHLLDPRYADWDALLLDAADAVVSELAAAGPHIADRTWGEANTSRIRHPLSRALPVLGRWLDMYPHRMSGDRDMPLVQEPSYGPSQRLVVSPGREQDGILHMPGGQSGHPLSPYYRAGHSAWVRGEPAPFLPGRTRHSLVLHP
jgi:penicillin G amidase